MGMRIGEYAGLSRIMLSKLVPTMTMLPSTRMPVIIVLLRPRLRICTRMHPPKNNTTSAYIMRTGTAPKARPANSTIPQMLKNQPYAPYSHSTQKSPCGGQEE